MLTRTPRLLLVGLMALTSCGAPTEADDTADGAETASAETLDEGIGTRVCDLLEATDVARYSPSADDTGVYDGFLAPLADVCRFEGAFTLQLDYGPLMGEPAEVSTYVSTTAGTAFEAITVGGFQGLLDYTEADADLETEAFVNKVLVQVADWVLILDPDDLIDPFGPESAVLQELAGIAAGGV